jgi:ATP/maltotriose-dependent transcriptional regulator MalT/DNA-binding SARP family transcriptional activator
MKNENHQIAKFSPPRVHSVFQRKRLFTLLDDSIDSPAIWVSGVPGSGKTTLVASYIESRETPYFWYQVDESDTDVATFFHYFTSVGHEMIGNKKEKLPEFRPEYLSNIAVFSRTFFREFFSSISFPFVLVFDNYQEAGSGNSFHEIIRTAIEEVSRGISLIFLSRGQPPKILYRFVLNNAMVMVGPDQIRFTEEEALGIAEQLDKGVDHRKTLDIYKSADGWAAGIVLMLEYLHHETTPVHSHEMSCEAFFNYFSGEIFLTLPDETQHFLLTTAFLPTITPKKASRISGLSNAGSILTELYQKNYFIKKYSGPPTSFSYHPLFRDFLLWRAQELFGLEEMNRLRKKAAKILVSAGEFEAAISMYADAENWRKVLSLVQVHAKSMLEEGRYHELETWLDRIPEDEFETSPWANFYRGLCFLYHSPDMAQPLFEKSFFLFPKSNFIGRFASWSGAVDSILYTWDDFTNLDPWIEKMEQMRKAYMFLPVTVLKNRVAISMFGALLYRKPFHRDIEKWTRRATVAMQTRMPLSQRMLITYQLVTYYVWTGEFAKARIIIDNLKSEASKSTIPVLTIAANLVASLYFWLAEPDYGKCHKEVTRALQDAEASGVHHFDGQLLGNIAAAALLAGNLTDAEKYLNNMNKHTISRGRLERSLYHHLAGWLAMLKEDDSLAQEHAAKAILKAEEAGVVMPQAMNLQCRALLLIEKGTLREAQDLVLRAKNVARGVYAGILKFFRHLLLADILLKQGSQKKGLKELKVAMQLGRERGFMTTPWWNPSWIVGLCTEALQADIEKDFVRELIQKQKLFPENSPVEIADWPWRVKIFTLGRFGVVIDGKPLRFTGKTQQKPLELLKALIALGGRDISRERLEDILWPDADGDKASQAMLTTVFRLRKLVGFDQFIDLTDKKFTLDNRYCWVDIWAMERFFGQVDQQIKQSEISEQRLTSLTDGVVSLYQGDFLANESEEPWIWPTRARLKSRHLKYLTIFSKAWEDLRKYEKAATLYHHGIEIDPLIEEFYQGLMKCYIKKGRLADARTIYESCHRVLKEGLGISPSPKTQSLRKKIG